jgi:hypothetical protein
MTGVAALSLGLLLGACSDDHGTTAEVKSDMKKMGSDIKEGAQKAGDKAMDGLSKAGTTLEQWGKDSMNWASMKGDELATNINGKMPELQTMVDTVKAKLNAAGGKFKDVVASLDDKMATLKTKVAELAKGGANAAANVKTDVVNAFNSLTAELKNAMSKITT